MNASSNTSLHRTPAAGLSSVRRGATPAPVSSKPLGDLSADDSGQRAIVEATAATGIAVAILLLSACAGRPEKGQWVLKEYDKDKGYTFVHESVVYRTDCFATGRPVLADNKPDLDPGTLPPEPASAQSACADVLRYLGKPVPNLTQPYPSILLFVGEDNWRLEFMIESAK